MSGGAPPFLDVALAVAALAAAAPAAASEGPICADRPGKANGTCTVPARRVQVETGLVSWSHDRRDGVRADDVSLLETAIKLGLTDRSHLELDIAPYAWSRVNGQSRRGFGDVAVRYKHRLTAGDARVEIAASPFVKLPTASPHVGNGKVEGGVAFPSDYSLTESLGLTLGPELDLVADADGRGRHLALVNVISLSAPLAPRVTISGDIWNAVDFDPSGSTRQWSAGASLAWLAANALQLDLGANFGLNRNTPDIELYLGVARRFR